MTTSAPSVLFRYWGKALRESSKTKSDRDPSAAACHLLPYHLLDVTAVAERLIAQHHGLRRRLAGLLDLPENRLVCLIRWLAAIHDLGKFARAFQSLQGEICLKLGQTVPERELYYRSDFRHDRLGLGLWVCNLSELASTEKWFGNVAKPSAMLGALEMLVTAATCHHGEPRDPPSRKGELDEHFRQVDQEAASAWCQWVRQELGVPQLDDIDCKAWQPKVRRASWLVAGVLILADWVGSNTRHFPYEDQIMALEAYWERAQANADAALQSFSLLPSQPDGSVDFRQLFKHIPTLSPLQQAACALALADGPQLILIEDVTGAGKTEAALALAQRLMASGAADGLFVGLPTMATANAMFERLGKSYRRFYASETTPSLALAHSARHLSASFRATVSNATRQAAARFAEGGFAEQMEDVNYQEEASASAMCNAWIADGRKKTFFADMAVGTLDQALQAILPTCHQALKLAGLVQKVLIADEVHAYDDYTGRLLESLLTFHAAFGGSAILLSATLPMARKDALIQAFAKGCSATRPEPPRSQDFPLLTFWNPALAKPQEYPVKTRPDLARDVKVVPLHSEQDVVETITRSAQAGRCVCWVRNTVSDAQEAYLRLKSLPALAGKVELFHARYALADRLAIERQVLERYGKDSTADQRGGWVLIATQVVEQSLDVDFDDLVTDFGPIDLLIQRGGRLHRHRRDVQGNPLGPEDGPDQRGAPVLHLFLPAFTAEPTASWLGDFKGTAFVYDDHGLLWRTARLFDPSRGRDGWRMPDDARALLEEVYDADAKTPEVLSPKVDKAEGKALAERQKAVSNALKVDEGYMRLNQSWQDDAHFMTRIGGDTGTVWLACWDGQRLRPWRDDLPDSQWEYSAVSLRLSLFARGLDNPPWSAALATLSDQLPGKGKYGRVLVLQQGEEGRWYGEGLDKHDRKRRFSYQGSEEGFREEKGKA